MKKALFASSYVYARFPLLADAIINRAKGG
jgi:hypothetical protein